ncbi:MAG: hypothetical protein ACU4EQ_13425 [Candidatus Nitrosoglobus sp.]
MKQKLYNLLALLFSTVVLTITIFIIPSAATASEDIKSIQQVASSEVRSCKFLADIQGFSGWGESAMGIWKSKAKFKALQQAADLNATHVVWTRLREGYGSGPYAYGKAYNCDNTKRLADRKPPNAEHLSLK